MKKFLFPIAILVYMGVGSFFFFAAALSQQNLSGGNEVGLLVGFLLGCFGLILLIKSARPSLFVLVSVFSIFFLFLNHIVDADDNIMGLLGVLFIPSIVILFSAYVLVVSRKQI
ncbi:MAG: hypothetical protein Q8Q23_05180 [bacterium]|nr:hypothetical protein [bacterium]